MKHLSLRQRIFLFFCLAALGSLCIVWAALWIGFRQLADPAALSAFVTIAILASLGITGLITFVWLLFDENVSKPVEAIAASLRVRAHVDVNTPLDVASAKYLGDLAPAASAMSAVLQKVAQSRSEKTDQQIAELTAQKDKLIKILSDIPIATILASGDHQIVLYDGQAAALMERVGTARLNTSVFDYVDRASILTALSQMERTATNLQDITVTAHCGTVYSGHIRRFDTDAGYTLMLEPLEPSASRPISYDFDLLMQKPALHLHDTALRDLTFVVFDCETTGLDPTRDEVVQIGAVRVINGKTVPGEAFETLVNPGIAIPRQSTKVHGIDAAMVANAPQFGSVCQQFHDFAKDAIIVAHNAAFDMAFLHKQSRQTGTRFDHPVLDTVLVSAVVFGGSAVHTLDAICDRLGIAIPEGLRHTAMGDAVVTAKALLAMLNILEERGIATFGTLQGETDKHRRILQA